MEIQQADYFLVPLLDGRFGLGQVFEHDDGIPFCALTAATHAPDDTVTPFSLNDVIAFVRLDPASISTGLWPRAGFDQIPKFRDVFDYDGTRALAFPNHPVHDPAVIEAFLSAWHGLYQWDAFGDLFDQIKRAHLDRPPQSS